MKMNTYKIIISLLHRIMGKYEGGLTIVGGAWWS